MDTFETIKKRRSIRKYQDRKIDLKLLEEIVGAAAMAPSACNIQGWKFIVIDQQSIKDKIVKNGGSILIKNTPTGILVLYDNQTINSEYHDDIQSAAAAIENLMLAATAKNLGCCWICHLPKKNVLRKILKIPGNYSPIAYVLIGIPLTEPKNMARKYKLADIMSFNKFSADWPLTKINPGLILTKKVLVKIYYLLPSWLKKGLINNWLDKNIVKKFDN